MNHNERGSPKDPLFIYLTLKKAVHINPKNLIQKLYLAPINLNEYAAQVQTYIIETIWRGFVRK